jgi:hypothetical protein
MDYYNNLRWARPKLGDSLLMLASVVLLIVLFYSLWQHTPAAKVRIRQGDHIYALLSLDQNRTLRISGPMGDSVIQIAQGQVRFVESPCHNQYCVHQGWLNKTGQAAICLPNRVTLELIGQKKSYDSLAY